MAAPAVESVEVDLESLTREEKVAAIAKYMADGKMAFLKGEHGVASEAFSHAAEYAVNVYGEFAEECYEPHFQYGRTLLEIARLQSLETGTDFTNVKEYIEKMALERDGETADGENVDTSRVGNPDDVPVAEIEKVDIAEKVAEALEENAAELDELAAAKEEEATATDDSNDAPAEEKESTEADGDNIDTTTGQNESTATAVEKEDPEENKDSAEAPEEMEVDEAGGEDDDDEEPTNAQAAWEVLEVARCICERQDKNSPEWQRKTGRVLGCLGSLSIIDENFEKAIEDLEQAITLLKPLEDTDRIISSIYVEVADSHRLLYQFDKAVVNYEAAYALLNARLEEAVKDQENNKDAEPHLQEEIQELKVLVKDLKGAIDDAKGSAADAKRKAAAAAAAAKASPSKSNAENSTPVNDISSSVRKVVKRPPPPTDDSEETESKKPKTDDEADVSNDAATTAAGDATTAAVEAPTSAPAAEAAAASTETA